MITKRRKYTLSSNRLDASYSGTFKGSQHMHTGVLLAAVTMICGGSAIVEVMNCG